jgi:hypothetical protein
MTSPFVGSWSYRSFQNNPDLAVEVVPDFVELEVAVPA